jgi:hypothetical protein
MKRILIPVFALFLAAGSASAQEVKEKYKQKDEMRRGGMEHDLDQLNLTADQKARIQQINADYRQQMENLKNDTTGGDRRAKMETMHQQHMEAVRAVLTDEQRTQWDAMHQQGGPGMKGKHKMKGDGDAMMDMELEHKMESLNLSDEQKNRVATVNQEYRQQMEALRSENLSKDEMRTRREALQRQHVENLKAVLTEEQRTRWEARHHDMKGKEIKQKTKDGKTKTKMKQKSSV